ncbi:MAG: rhomboid family intramembrane serine protease [Alphaproteobacteria bacterium]|nr:rhomboid family intramembrane serine protease [Alphaproteobacteria bacterium]MBV9695075.1 rhomboid family intramembrane serine protease [Alphaproteobacteria bacterium]
MIDSEQQEGAPRRGWGLAAFFVPRRQFWGLPLLLDVNILVYVAMVASGLGVMEFDVRDLVDWGANFRPALEGWGWLRLLTSTFVHGGLIHIAMNMYGLLIAGVLIAPAARNARLILCYLICGAAGSAASAFMHAEVVSVGASGAIFGLFGMLFALLMLGDGRFRAQRKSLLSNAAFVIALNLGLSFAIPGIDASAHIGGLIAGFFLGVLFYFLDRREVAF